MLNDSIKHNTNFLDLGLFLSKAVGMKEDRHQYITFPVLENENDLPICFTLSSVSSSLHAQL